MKPIWMSVIIGALVVACAPVKMDQVEKDELTKLCAPYYVKREKLISEVNARNGAEQVARNHQSPASALGAMLVWPSRIVSKSDADAHYFVEAKTRYDTLLAKGKTEGCWEI